MKRIIIAIILAVVGIWLVIIGLKSEDLATVNSFDECAAAGQPVMESYPRQCRAEDGRLFVEDIGNELEKSDFIRAEHPRPNQLITSPLVISGEARGVWFFEASFPVRLEDGEGNVIARHFATAQGEWMTEEFVPFEGELEFDIPLTDAGNLYLEKDNPSGLPENYDELQIPVRFR